MTPGSRWPTMNGTLAACEARGGRDALLALARVLPVVSVAERLTFAQAEAER